MPRPHLNQSELKEWDKLREKGMEYIKRPNIVSGAITNPENREKDGVSYLASIDQENSGYIQFRRLDPDSPPTVGLKTKLPTIDKTTGKKIFSLFPPLPKPPQTIEQKMEKAGLKFHIALPDHYNRGTPNFNDEEKLRAKSWSIISNKLMLPGKKGAPSFKVINPVHRFSDADHNYNCSTMNPNHTSQYGKDVVVYARASDEKTPQEWVQYMRELSDELAEAGIPGHLPILENDERKTTPLGESPYVCFRFENFDDDFLLEKINQEVSSTQFKPVLANSMASATNNENQPKV